IRSLLSVHAFVGMLLIPVVGLKIVSTGWRMARYYLRGEEYVRRGPPHLLLRMLVAPALLLSTLVVFGTGVALLGLHKAGFVRWIGAFALHVLAPLLRLPRLWRLPVPGAALRLGVVTLAVVAGVTLATETLPAADRLQDHAAAHVGFDDG